MFQLFLLVTLYLFSVNATSSYFINENSSGASPDGSSDNPFSSLSQAVEVLGPISCTLYLQGSSISVTSAVNFPVGSNYLITPSPDFSGLNYPIYLDLSGSLRANSSNLTLNNLEFIELNYSKSANSAAIVLTSSNLYMKNILVQNLDYASSGYLFVRSSGNGATNEVVVTDSVLKQLTNFEFCALIGTKLVMNNNTMKNLVNNVVPLIVISSYTANDASCSITNFDMQNVIMGNMGNVGFVTIISSRLNFSFENFFIKNVTINDRYPVIMINLSKNDSAGLMTSVDLRNGHIEHLIENNTFPTDQVNKSSLSLFMLSQGPSNLFVDNLTLNYTRLKNYNFITFTPGVFLGSDWTILPYGYLNGITIKNSSNANFWLGRLDVVLLENILVQDNFFADANISYFLFDIQLVHEIYLKNVLVENNAGPVFGFNEILQHSLENVTFRNVTTSRELRTVFQYLIALEMENDPVTDGLDPNRPTGTTINNLNVNGFKDIKGENSTQENTYPTILSLYTISGDSNIYLTNCVWKNLEVAGITSSSLKYLKIDNLTIEEDPGTPFSNIIKHQFFTLMGIETFEITNSQFKNNQNAVILSLFNLERTSFASSIKKTSLKFSNLTVTNNTANHVEKDTGFGSLFMFYSPKKPVILDFNNSSLYNNTALTGLIAISECYQIDAKIENNTFDHNTATEQGGVLWASSLRQNTNTLNLTNNTFTNNYCNGIGGVYYIILANFQITLDNNIYKNNAATASGGVGYITRSDVLIAEKDSYYYGNSAGTNGGAWYLSLRITNNDSPPYSINNNIFIKSSASQRGGAYFIEAGNLVIKKYPIPRK